MRRIGIHTSTAGGPAMAARRALDLGANCFQIFSGNPRGWHSPPVKPESAAQMRATRAEHDLTPLVIHDIYLINLASPDSAVRAKSIAAFRGELERAILLAADYLVMHPGSARDSGVEQGIATLAASLREASQGLRPQGLTLLFENTAGGGATLGRTFAELRAIRDAVVEQLPYPTGYCLDTCHLYASGFDVSTAQGLNATLDAAAATLGLDNIPVVHTNDSQGALGSRLDRHANIGEGRIGLPGFRRIVNHPALRAKAFILETPIDKEGDDRRNLETLKALCRNSHRPQL